MVPSGLSFCQSNVEEEKRDKNMQGIYKEVIIMMDHVIMLDKKGNEDRRELIERVQGSMSWKSP